MIIYPVTDQCDEPGCTRRIDIDWEAGDRVRHTCGIHFKPVRNEAFMTYTREQKRALYRVGRYHFPVPPVTTGRWNEDNWIDYIDQHGAWYKKQPKDPCRMDPHCILTGRCPLDPVCNE